MAKSNIVYQYFKKVDKENTIFIQYDSIRSSGSKLTVQSNGDIDLEDVDFGGNVIEDLKENGYTEANALEFHLILNGLKR